MRAEMTDKKGEQYQKMYWDALRKSINGLVNKVNVANIKNLVPEIFAENLVRGKGLLCRAVMKAQMASPTFTNVYAALIAIINTKMPEIGELLLKRIVMQFRRAYKRNDKIVCLSCVKFLAHLVNQQVAHELVALQLITLLLEKPTDDGVEVCVDFVKESGKMLTDITPRGVHGVFERLRGILHEGEIDKRVQYMIEGLFAVRKTGFKDFPALVEGLDLIETDDQITHEVALDENHEIERQMDIYHLDPNFEENEKIYAAIKVVCALCCVCSSTVIIFIITA
jgi:pre-mRNA-splicing factor CWC22